MKPTKEPSAAPTEATQAPSHMPTEHPCDGGSHGCDLVTTMPVKEGASCVCQCLEGYVRNPVNSTWCDPTFAPTTTPTEATDVPTASPTYEPTFEPTSGAPTAMPSHMPTEHPCSDESHYCWRNEAAGEASASCIPAPPCVICPRSRT